MPVQRSCERCGATFCRTPSDIAKGRGRFCSRSCRAHVVARRPLERFWQKVNKDGPLLYGNTPCWIWTGWRDALGYGHFHHSPARRSALTHRVAWELAVGPIPEGMDLCHHCDNPPCVNPDHLFPGTQSDNVRDMNAKDRHGHTGAPGDRNGSRLHPERLPRGDLASWSRLTEALVRQLRQEYAAGGVTYTDLGLKYNVSRSTAHLAVTRKTWVHVT